MISDLLFRQIARTAALDVGIGLTERSCVRANGAVDTQITSQSCYAGPLRPLDGGLSGQLTPIDRHAHADVSCHLANPGQVLNRSKMRPPEFMNRGDTLRRRRPQCYAGRRA